MKKDYQKTNSESMNSGNGQEPEARQELRSRLQSMEERDLRKLRLLLDAMEAENLESLPEMPDEMANAPVVYHRERPKR